jgi:serine/threonine protein kinase
MLIFEAHVNLYLQGIQLNQDMIALDQDQTVVGFPQVFCYGESSGHNFMTMNLLGPSLYDLHTFCGYTFSLKTTIMIAYQMIERFEYMHGKEFIHRDIKPENFVMGLNEQSAVLSVVDMGIAKRFIDNTTKEHIAYRNDKHLTGTARYTSVHSHLGEELSRRDDLEGVLYTMIYLHTGYLPW